MKALALKMTMPCNNNDSNETAREPQNAHLQPANLDPVEGFGGEPKRLRSNCETKRELPSWAKGQIPRWGERVYVPEWDDDDNINDKEIAGDCVGSIEDEMNDCYRSKNGWKGTDLCHSRNSPVRISHYGVQFKEGGVGTVLTGLCHYTSTAESHAGYCHGGSMTSVMDDIIGWTGFLVTGECLPWSGFTAQVNVSLMRPIAVGSYLKVVGKIVKWEGRKVWIHSELLSGENNEREEIHCTAEGLVVLKK